MIPAVPTLAVGDFYGDSTYWNEIVLLSADRTNTRNSLQDIYGLTFAAAANHTYEVDAIILVSTPTGNGVHATISCTGAGSTGSVLLTAMFSATAILESYMNLGTGDITGWDTTLGTKVIGVLRSLVVMSGSAGNITVQYACAASPDTATAYAGSVMKVKQLA